MVDDPLADLRKLLDPERWPTPIKRGDYVILHGEVYAFRGDHPLEERIYKPLFR